MKTGVKALLGGLFCLLCLTLGTVIGSAGLSLGDTLAILAHRLLGAPLPERIPGIAVSILWTIRLPRVIGAFLVGAALSVSGAVMQSVLRNPLASSYTLGVSAGASLAAAAVILSGVTLPLLPSLTRPLAGFAGGLATVFLAMGLAARF
ncbi:MAG: iron chelate uptake ABC transporter family permease subunit, partial [Clostridia bacterium]|nr:iron chelate uptake ABC transporter family permease subunit [Clostridia bacterium]